MPAFEYGSSESDSDASERPSTSDRHRKRRRSASTDDGVCDPPKRQKAADSAASSAQIVLQETGRSPVLGDRSGDNPQASDNDEDLLPDDKQHADPQDTVPADRAQFLSQVEAWFAQLDGGTKAQIQIAMQNGDQAKLPAKINPAFSQLTEQELSQLTEEPDAVLELDSSKVESLFTSTEVKALLERTAGGLEMSRNGLAKLSKRYAKTGDPRADKSPVTENLFDNFPKHKTVEAPVVRFMDKCMAQLTETINLVRRPLLRSADLVQHKINDGTPLSFQEAEARTASHWALRALAHAQYQLQALRRIANLAPLNVSISRLKGARLEPLINAPIEVRSDSERYNAGADIRNAPPLLCSHNSLKLLHEHGKGHMERTSGLTKGLGVRVKPDGDARPQQRFRPYDRFERPHSNFNKARLTDRSDFERYRSGNGGRFSDNHSGPSSYGGYRGSRGGNGGGGGRGHRGRGRPYNGHSGPNRHYSSKKEDK